MTLHIILETYNDDSYFWRGFFKDTNEALAEISERIRDQGRGDKPNLACVVKDESYKSRYKGLYCQHITLDTTIKLASMIKAGAYYGDFK